MSGKAPFGGKEVEVPKDYAVGKVGHCQFSLVQLASLFSPDQF